MKRFLLSLALACPLSAAAQEPSNLPIGDPARKDKMVEVTLDGINDAATGEIITPKELAARLAGVRVVFVGESHTSMEYHNVQRRLIEELTAVIADARLHLAGLAHAVRGRESTDGLAS